MRSKKTLIGMFTALSIAMVLAMVFGAFALQTSRAAGTPKVVASLGKPMFYQFHHPMAAMHIHQGTSTPLATWTSSFTYNTTNYPYTMVGTDPTNGSATTTVATKLIPLKVVFSGGSTLNGSGKTSLVKNSPIYKSATYSSGTTQFADAMQRAEFWQIVNSTAPNYHVLLGTPTVTSTATLKVPSTYGYTEYVNANGKNVLIGLIDLTWFDSQIQGFLLKYGIAPNNFPIFLSNNVFLYEGSSSNCCVFGYHNAVNTSQGAQTYAWSSYASPGIFDPGIQDIDGLSHEVAEWMNDPYGTNTVPSWSVPNEPQYGCTSVLEVGDPLVGTTFTVTIGKTTYHPQDIAFFSWFALQSPSIGINGYYDYLNTFSTYASSC